MPGPKPTKLHVLEGTYRPDRHRGRRDVELEHSPPEPPGWLSKEAREEWDRLLADERYAAVIAGVDRGALAAYVTVWAEFEIASRNGVEVPASRLQLMLTLGAKLGLNPQDRARLSLPDPPRMKSAFAALNRRDDEPNTKDSVPEE